MTSYLITDNWFHKGLKTKDNIILYKSCVLKDIYDKIIILKQTDTKNIKMWKSISRYLEIYFHKHLCLETFNLANVMTKFDHKQQTKSKTVQKAFSAAEKHFCAS